MGFLDTGAFDRGFEPLISAEWVQLVIRNVDFVNSTPVAAMAVGSDQIIIFGGQTSKTFMIEDARADVNPMTQQANVRTCQSHLQQQGRFANSCDFITRSFGNYHYVMDCNLKYLHMYKEREQEWESLPLTELGITDE